MLLKHLPADEPDLVFIRVELYEECWRARDKLYATTPLTKRMSRTGLSAMMRTTAFPASIIAQMMARGRIKEKGAIPQERCVPPDCGSVGSAHHID